jgi:lysophospholipase L1-like esterase
MKYLIPTLLIASLLAGCRAPSTRVVGDSVVLASTRPANLLYPDLDSSRGVAVRSTYPTIPSTITYTEGVDYTLDRRAGTIARTPNSRIPDFSKNILYNQPNFNHSAFPGYGNLPFTLFVDYATRAPQIQIPPVDVSHQLPATAKKLRAGQPLKLVAYGDSITAGGDASSPDLQYPALYAAHLRKLFPQSTITFENGATGGDTTRDGLARLEGKVLSRSPDLVLLAFGMNDHNVNSVPLPEFEQNLVTLVQTIRDRTGAECILISTFPPNEDWAFGSHNMAAYAEATRRAADRTNCAYADLYTHWQKVLKRKDAPSLLGNNINHPNDFGHNLYLQVLQSLKF